MSGIKVVVGGTLEEAGAAFVEAWERAEAGEVFQDRAIVFESWHGLARVLTGKRYDLLRYVRRHPVPSVAALARALGRDYRRVHADVDALVSAGLLDRANGGVQADYDAIETRIAI